MIGSRVLELRKAKGWTQRELGEKLSVSGEMVSKYERDESDAPDETKVALARIFNVSADYLLGLTDEPYPLIKPDFILPHDFPDSELDKLSSYAEFLKFQQTYSEDSLELLKQWNRLAPESRKHYLEVIKNGR